MPVSIASPAHQPNPQNLIEEARSLYLGALKAARDYTGLSISSEGEVNRPRKMAETLNRLAKDGCPENAFYAMAVAIVAALLFPRSRSEMSGTERDEQAMFTQRYVPKGDGLRKLFDETAEHLRFKLLPLVRDQGCLIDDQGRLLFEEHGNPMVQKTVNDLVLTYHSAFTLEHKVDTVGLFLFLVRGLKEARPGVRPFELSSLEWFVEKHFLPCLQGEKVVELSAVQHRNLAFGLYSHHALDPLFRAGQLAEGKFCAEVAQCTKRGHGQPPRPLSEQPLPYMTEKGLKGLHLANTVAADEVDVAVAFED